MTEKDEHPRPEEPRQIVRCPCRLGMPGPSQDLLERARVGWVRFIGSLND
ncbi:hypothetical protein ACFV0H_36180 [Streptomyces erythrochromogenes]